MPEKIVVDILDERLLNLIRNYYRYLPHYSTYCDECRARMLEVCRIAFLIGAISDTGYENCISIIAMIGTNETVEDRIL